MHASGRSGKFLALFTLIFCFGFRDSQGPDVVIKARSESFTADHLGNIYTVNGDEVMKFLPNGRMSARYSNLQLGRITHLDVSNPLKILLYYRDFQQIVFLDNQLSLNSKAVSLEELGYEQTELVCASTNNSFWIYDKQNNELLRFDENSRRVAATGNLKQVLRAGISPNYMTEYNNYLFLNSPSEGIYVFDMFGAFSKLIAIKDLHEFQLTENLVYYQRDSLLCSYDHRIFEEACLRVRDCAPGSRLLYQNKRIYCGNRDSVFSKPYILNAGR